jgi:hypothetical protein
VEVLVGILVSVGNKVMEEIGVSVCVPVMVDVVVMVEVGVAVF